MSPRIEHLREDVEVMHKCKAQDEKPVPVVEMFGSKTVRETANQIGVSLHAHLTE